MFTAALSTRTTAVRHMVHARVWIHSVCTCTRGVINVRGSKEQLCSPYLLKTPGVKAKPSTTPFCRAHTSTVVLITNVSMPYASQNKVGLINTQHECVTRTKGQKRRERSNIWGGPTDFPRTCLSVTSLSVNALDSSSAEVSHSLWQVFGRDVSSWQLLPGSALSFICRRDSKPVLLFVSGKPPHPFLRGCRWKTCPSRGKAS